MKSSKLLYILLIIFVFALGACKKNAPETATVPNPKACKQKCPAGEELQTDCSCKKALPPEPFSPDASLQLQLINAVINNDAGFVKKQLDANMHVNAYLSLSSAENILNFRESLKQNNWFLYDNIKKDTSDLTLLFLSVAANKQAIFDEVMGHNPDVGLASFGNITPYQMALINNDTAKAKALLDKGAKASLNAVGQDNDLVKAIDKKDFATASMLIAYAAEKGIDVSSVIPPLSKAVETNNKDLIAFLIDSAKQNPDGKDISAKNYPIGIAILGGNIEVAKMLLAAGANINIQNDKGLTPLMLLLSAFEGVQDQAKEAMRANIRFILQNSAAIDAVDNKGKTALFYAVEQKDTPAIDLLLAAGADINHKNNAGETAIFMPAKEGNIEMVKTLLQKGALAKIKNKQGITPAMYAVQSGYMDIYDTLESSKK